MNNPELIPNLFRTQFSKIVSVLCKTFGIHNIQIAEDIASDTFLTATETWSLKGVPETPEAWLYAVAKNKSRDYLKRESLFDNKISHKFKEGSFEIESFELDLSEHNIKDSQLRMLFNVCDPLLSQESQIPLALRVLCGFGISEIATALLTSKSTINKRILRAKDSYRKYNISLELPNEQELESREDNVLLIIYLLFNEGYYSSSSNKTIRKNLCLESMRLLYFFLEYHNSKKANALMALFCFHASRFESREDEFGNLILYSDQDDTKWDQDLIRKGEYYLQTFTMNDSLSKYQLEASIAYLHTRSEDNKQKWEGILQLYNHLLQLEYSPIIALNRTYALAKANGKRVALEEALKIDLTENHLYHMLLADLYTDSDKAKQMEHLEKAESLAKTDSEKSLIRKKIDEARK